MGLVSKEVVVDDPPHSRLFVVFNRKDPLSEEELHDEFCEFGEIQDIFVVKERGTGESKGLAYVKFAKMSQAALAMEKLNNQPIKNKSGTFKIYVAKNKGEAKGSDQDDPGRFLRLFVTIPKTASESDVKLHFSKFGDVTSVKILRNRDSNESKGICYVTYSRPYEAAIAVEEGENDEGFKAVIARPKAKVPLASQLDTRGQSTSHASDPSSRNYHSNSDYFTAFVSSKLKKDHIFRLFDIAPGLRNIEIVSQNLYRSEVIATYNSALSAEYALNKLHGIEYPDGEFISVGSKTVNDKSNSFQKISHSGSTSGSFSGSIGGKRDYRGEQRDYLGEPMDYDFRSEERDYRGEKRDYRSEQRDHRGEPMDFKIDSPSRSTESNDEVHQKLSALTKALTDASVLLKSHGLSTDNLGFNSEKSEPRKSYSSHCDFPLPPLQDVLPKGAFDESTGMRLFFVGHPSAPPLEALFDVYCRFGNFAGASVMARKNYGYLYYTSPESAKKAIQATDDKIISGICIKVMRADPKKTDSSFKRKKVEN